MRNWLTLNYVVFHEHWEPVMITLDCCWVTAAGTFRGILTYQQITVEDIDVWGRFVYKSQA